MGSFNYYHLTFVCAGVQEQDCLQVYILLIIIINMPQKSYDHGWGERDQNQTNVLI